MNGNRPGPGILRLTVELFMLPVRTFLHGMERMVETLKDIQRVTDRGADSFLGGPARGDRYPQAPPRPATFGSVARPPTAEFGDTETFEEPQTAGGARDGAGEQPSKEDSRMYTDQDLSGDMVKVVQYCIVSVVTSVEDNARIVVPPQVRAFADDMTPEDFTSWMIAENHHLIHKYKCSFEQGHEHEHEHEHHHHHHHHDSHGPRPWDRKYLRVAFSVMGRFSPADIDWTELQARSVARIARHFDGPQAIAPIQEPPAATGKSAKAGS